MNFFSESRENKLPELCQCLVLMRIDERVTEIHENFFSRYRSQIKFWSPTHRTLPRIDLILGVNNGFNYELFALEASRKDYPWCLNNDDMLQKKNFGSLKISSLVTRRDFRGRPGQTPVGGFSRALGLLFFLLFGPLWKLYWKAQHD